MKLRIKGDSIRLRLTQSEVSAVAGGDAVVETTSLPQPFTYALEASGERIGAAFAAGRMTVSIPHAIALRWASTEEVSLRGREGAVEILVEKDFACLVPREGEEDPDAFRNPLAERGTARGTERA
ncbi:MAG: hypothetical protein OXI90_12420 [Gammaproteobacteria bacterium]|nr:hypothetical protein [Gammaproteobacteria bacterium]